MASPYVAATGMVAEVMTPAASYRVIQGPLRDGTTPKPAPRLGEHTAEVMVEVLGADSPDLAALID